MSLKSDEGFIRWIYGNILNKEERIGGGRAPLGRSELTAHCEISLLLLSDQPHTSDSMCCANDTLIAKVHHNNNDVVVG